MRSLVADRLLLGLLVLVCGGLLFGGPPVEPPQHGDRLPDVASQPSPPELRFAASDVENVLREANPLLDANRRGRIARAVVRYSGFYGLDPELVTAVVLVESDARPWARSPKGAIGLMQVMPHMMSPMGLAGNAATIESNIEAGCRILAGNIRRLGEDRGISAYFWGSEIRGVAYLQRVREARAAMRDLRDS
jgi:hypothetical protein